jgi:hypothetical protein
MNDIPKLIIILSVTIGLFLFFGYIFMLLWNSCVVKIAKKDTIQKISYGTSLGLLFMVSLFSGTTVICNQKYN